MRWPSLTRSTLKTQIAVLVGGRGTYDTVVEIDRRKEQMRFTAEIDIFNDILGCARRDLASVQIWIDKRSDTDFGQITRAMSRDLTQPMHHDTDMEGIGLNLIALDLPHGARAFVSFWIGWIDERPSDQALGHSVMHQVVDAFDLAIVTLEAGHIKRQVSGCARIKVFWPSAGGAFPERSSQ